MGLSVLAHHIEGLREAPGDSALMIDRSFKYVVQGGEVLFHARLDLNREFADDILQGPALLFGDETGR